MNTLYNLILNRREAYASLENQKRTAIFILFITSVINSLITYIIIKPQLTESALLLSQKVGKNLHSISSLLSSLTIVVGFLFPILTIATSSLMFFLFSKFLINYSNYKKIFLFFLYVFPLTLVGNLMNFLLKTTIPIDGVRWTSLNAIFQLNGSIGSLLNAFDIFQVWTIILIYNFLIRTVNMPKSSALISLIVYAGFIVMSIFVN